MMITASYAHAQDTVINLDTLPTDGRPIVVETSSKDKIIVMKYKDLNLRTKSVRGNGHRVNGYQVKSANNRRPDGVGRGR